MGGQRRTVVSKGGLRWEDVGKWESEMGRGGQG